MRPNCVTAASDAPCPDGVTAYLAIYNSVRGEAGLIHGKLHDAAGRHCAIGSFFSAVDGGTALPTSLIDEVAIVNDSCPSSTRKQRKLMVLRWLRWKLTELGFPMRRVRK